MIEDHIKNSSSSDLLRDLSPSSIDFGTSSPIENVVKSTKNVHRPSTSREDNDNMINEMTANLGSDLENKTVPTSGKWKKKKKHHHSKDDSLKAQMDQMQLELSEMRSEQKVQRQMLQLIVDFCNEYKDTPSNHESIELEKKTGFPKVGFTRVADNSIHLGQGVFVAKNSYLAATSRSKSTSQFVRKIMMAVFTTEELQACSVHGAKSNKIKQDAQKPGLDSTKLQAVKDIFSYYLKELGMPTLKYDQEMKAFYSYVSSKITDTRAVSKHQPKEKKNSSTVEDSDLEEDTIASNDEDDSEQESDDESTSDETPYTQDKTVEETKVSTDEKEVIKKKNQEVLDERAEEEKEDVSASVIPSNNKEDEEKISSSDKEN